MTLTYEFKIEKTTKGYIVTFDSNDAAFSGEDKDFYKTKEDVIDFIDTIIDEKLP